MLADAGSFAGEQGGLNAHDREHAAAEIADRDTGAHRFARICARDGHAAAKPLHDLIEGRALVVGAVLAEAGDRAGDDGGIVLAERVVVDLQPFRHPRREVVQHHVCVAHQFVEEPETGGGFEVDGDGALVAVQGEVVGAHAADGVARIVFEQPPGRLAPPRRLDLDRVAAEIGKDHAGIRTRQHVRQIDQPDAGQRLVGRELGHRLSAEVAGNRIVYIFAGGWTPPGLAKLAGGCSGAVGRDAARRFIVARDRPVAARVAERT